MRIINSQEEILNADYDIQHKITDYNEIFCSHIHKDFEIFFINCDGVVGTIGQKKYSFKKNTVVLLNSFDSHWFGCKGKKTFDRYVTVFKLEFLNHISTQNTNLLDCFYYRPFPDPQILELTEVEASEFIALLESTINIINRSQVDSYGKDLEIILKFAKMLLMINRLYRKHHQIYSTTTVGKNHKLVYKVISYINNNYFEEITLDSLAEKFNINKFALCRTFSKVTNISPIKYLINCRLHKAKELLQTDLTVERVCFECGFNNLSNFSTSFKSYYLISPKSYQMKARKEKENRRFTKMKYGYCTGFATTPLWGTNKGLVQDISKSGYDFVEFPLMSLVKMSDKEFKEMLSLLKSLNLKCNSTCNFFPETIKLQEPEFNREQFSSYLDKAFDRAKAIGAEKIIFGSAAARKRDEKIISKDGAKQQLINLLVDYIGPKAKQNNIHILIEPMSYSAGNVINTILEADDIVKRTKHPNVKLMIDLLHMQNNNEKAENILDVLEDVEHIHVSDLERALPSDKMNPFLLKAFKLLRKNGYDNTVSYETVSGSLNEMTKALDLLKAQLY